MTIHSGNCSPMRILATILGCLALAGCSVLESIPEPANQAPTIKAASADIKRVAGDAKLAEPLEVAGPIEAIPVTVAPWIICVRSTSPDQWRRTYALFYRDVKLVSSRLSAIIDRCELQTFAPL
ncbi:conserved hypothetical protein [Rhodopseudomonas palustris BisB5]|uniref:Uncharacterized protein n=1 Tax=Rhodopseudomonas palustris (strain BisB5) TaxID=316057 RepID=Q13B40_RHOPS|nr:conserved hypothetical protein [Rhodopseudomonas palustris BisB5]